MDEAFNKLVGEMKKEVPKVKTPKQTPPTVINIDKVKPKNNKVCC